IGAGLHDQPSDIASQRCAWADEAARADETIANEHSGGMNECCGIDNRTQTFVFVTGHGGKGRRSAGLMKAGATQDKRVGIFSLPERRRNAARLSLDRRLIAGCWALIGNSRGCVLARIAPATLCAATSLRKLRKRFSRRASGACRLGVR